MSTARTTPCLLFAPFLLLSLLLPAFSRAQGGMWLPMLLEKQNEKEMKSLGLKLSADDLYAPNRPSIKDAICLFDGGCTGEMISPEGLLLTNHHCGFDAIQQLSTAQSNYIEKGYWASNRAAELPAEGVTAQFVVRMEDVTALALQGVTEGMSEPERTAQIEKNNSQIRVNTKKEAWEDIQIRPFYNGNQYFLFIVQTFRDVRFVGAPPSSIGKFGSDTDNWVWPRHTGDFSVFRIYADKNNHPADYSKDNVPYRPAHFLPISLDGVEEDDFTMVYGFPGRTDEYLSAAAVKQIGEVLDPLKVGIRDRALKIMDGYMRKDPDIKLAYIAKYSGISNAWKKWQGEMLGLQKSKAVDKKLAYEAEFTRRIEQNADWKYRYGNLLPRLRQLYQDVQPYAHARDNYTEAGLRNIELMSWSASMGSWLKTFEGGFEAGFNKKRKDVEAALDGFYKDFRPEVDQAVFTGLMEMFAQNAREDWGGSAVKKQAADRGGYAQLADYLYKNSAFASKEKMKALMNESPAIVVDRLKKDPAYQFFSILQDAYAAQVQPKLQELQPQITLLQRQYMAAQMEVFREKRFFPDANSTLRLTYGRVDDYSPRDAV
ncbi:MAG TPA: S46 family peptidase, partial [Saprospiraceae bacterium]|nr:S46 family peptidase [Saprospiraceae bacterium]